MFDQVPAVHFGENLDERRGSQQQEQKFIIAYRRRIDGVKRDIFEAPFLAPAIDGQRHGQTFLVRG